MKRLFIVIAICMTLFILTACQSTPEEVIVVEKDTDRMIEKATEEIPEEEKKPIVFPERFQYELSELDGHFTVEADAEISAPEDLEELPIVRTQGRAFTQEEVTNIFNYLFDGRTAYVSDPAQYVASKEDIEASIVSYERAIQFGLDGEPLSEEAVQEYRAQIEALKKQYETAPEKSQRVVSDGTMWTGEQHRVQGQKLSVSDETGNTLLDIWSSAGSDSTVHYTTDRSYAVHESGDLLKEEIAVPESLTLSYTDAKILADELLAQTELGDAVLTAVYLADDRQIGLVDDKVSDAENYAYCFRYSSLIEGVPAADMSELIADSEFGAMRLYEKIEITVDNSGIAEFTWNAPYEIKELVSSNSNIVEFEAAAELFSNLMFQTYSFSVMGDFAEEEQNPSLEFDISEVQLCMVRIKDPDASGQTGDFFIPAYIFYGTGLRTSPAYEETVYVESPYVFNRVFTGRKPFIIINAIDGTHINPSEGY